MTQLCDCELNSGIAGDAQRICSQYTVQAESEDQDFTAHVKKFSQNNIDLFVGSMKVREILSVAMIPDLEFSQSNMDFAQYTHNQIDRMPGVPSRWQRPLKLSRERKIRNYFYRRGGAARQPKSVIPGAIILGEREHDGDFPAETVVKKLGDFGGNDILEIQTSFKLRGDCPCGWTPMLPNTNFDRCGRHERPNPNADPVPCPIGNHRKSVLPFQIIDGQHRVLGIMRLDPEEEVPVVFLLRNKQENEEESLIGVRGCSSTIQAEVFEKVNNASEKLQPEHELWIKRLLSPNSLESDEVVAFDTMADLGKRNSWTADNPWRDMIPMGPGGQRQFRINSVRSSYMRATGRSGAVARIMARITDYEADAALGTLKPKEQLTNFLKGATRRSPAGNRAAVRDLFEGRPRPFRGGRLFETILRNYDDVAKWAVHDSNSLDHDAFTKAWDLHSASFATVYTNNWRAFFGTGEQYWQEFENIWKLMWPDPDPAGGVAQPPVGPSWTAHQNWGEYCDQPPDPISLKSPPTPRTGGSSGPRWDDNAGNTNTIPAGAVDLVWEGPRNGFDQSRIFYRQENPVGSGNFDDWVEIEDAPVKVAPPRIVDYVHTLSLDLTTLGLTGGQKIGFKIVDRNIVGGATESEFQYEIA